MTPSGAPTPAPVKLIGGAALVVVAAVGAAAWWARGGHVEPRPVLLVVSGDTAGWIVPCGCTANQSGGMLRRGSHVRVLREQADVLVADAGGAPGGTSAYQRLKFEAILRGELALGVAAHNLGGPEAALGADYLRRIAGELRVPFVSANLRDSIGQLVAAPLQVVKAGGRRVGFTGVLARRHAGAGLQIDEPREALLRLMPEARKQCDSLVVLAYLAEDELRALAAALPEADAVIGGPTGQSIPPVGIGPTLVAAATNKGKFLIELQAARPGALPAWSGRVVEMGPQFADDPEQEANHRRYLEELQRRDFRADETGLAELLPGGLPLEYRLVGTTSCRSCHREACTAWERSGHAHAWDTLTARGSQSDPACQLCHTTGYGVPGGFESASRSPQARGVGCESCHGPAAAHVRQPATPTPVRAREQCTRCHDVENSPSFELTKYWPRIRHGQDASARTDCD